MRLTQPLPGVFATYGRMLGFLRPYKGRALGATLLMLLGALLQLPGPLLTRHLFDSVIPQGDVARLKLFVLLLVCLVAMGAAASLLQTRLLLSCRYGIERDLRRAVFRRVLGSGRSTEASGYLVSRVDDDVAQIQHLFLDPLLSILLQTLTFSVGVALLFQIHARLAVVALVSLPAFVISSATLSKRLHRQMGLRQESWARFRGGLQEGVAQAEVIQALGMEEAVAGRNSDALEVAIDASRRFDFSQVLASTLTGLTAAVLPMFVLWYGTSEILAGRFTIGGFIAFNAAIGFLYNPVRSIVGLNLDIRASLAAAQRILEMLELAQVADRFGAQDPGPFRELAAENLSYAYLGNDRRGLAKFSFQLQRGESLAVVGETGSGKSTLAKLLLGYDLPASGVLTFNGLPHNTLGLLQLRREIGFVPQEPDLLQGTIQENICRFKENQDSEQLAFLAQTCLLEDTLSRFPQGLATAVQEGGSGLSGGEKQRVALARALYSRPGLLVLDEATSAMDPATEAAVLQNLLNLPWRPAVLFITHRHSVLARFDRVVEVTSSTQTVG